MFHKKLRSILKYISFFTSVNLMWWRDKRIFEILRLFHQDEKFFHFKHWEFFFKRQLCFSEKKCFLSMFFQRLMITVHNIWLHDFSFSYSSMQHKHSQIQILSGQEINAYIRRLFSNCFESRSDDISWTFIYKYLDI